MPRDNVLDNEAEAARPRHRTLTIKESPHVVLSCASGFPHRIKFRKRVMPEASKTDVSFCS